MAIHLFAPSPRPTVAAEPVVAATGSMTATMTPTMTATASATASPADACVPGGGYTWLPYYSLDGDVLAVDASASDAAGCRRVCCATPGCTGFTLQVLPAPVRGTCALLANLSQLVPAVTFGAGVLRGVALAQ